MSETTLVKPETISFCGLYCAGCRSYIKGKCPGCEGNTKATWCKIRTCCMDKGIKSCADCIEYSKPMDCKKFNNFVSRMFALVFRSDRAASIEMIKKIGYDGYAQYCTENKIMVIRK
ncbi:MAG TPA: DUF3795 domain-containing protein [Bacteroidales bacterium]|nr:DUF3795 domain-containing protein [Bacteroidales bacterium]